MRRSAHPFQIKDRVSCYIARYARPQRELPRSIPLITPNGACGHDDAGLPTNPGLIDPDWTAGNEFGLAELGYLARRRPPETIEVGVPGQNGYFSATTGSAAMARLDAALEQLQSAPAWVVLKDVQQDATYATHIDYLFRSVLSSLHLDPDIVFNRRCHVFISSRGARTPLHADDCHGLLVQVSGNKEVVIHDMGKNYFSPRLARLRARTPRVFTLPASHTYRPYCFTVPPGMALTIPWNWPHEAATSADSWSVSLNVSFETPQTDRYARVAATNDLLFHMGRTPTAIGVNKRSDTAKALVGSAINGARLLSWFERYRQIGDEVVR